MRENVEDQGELKGSSSKTNEFKSNKVKITKIRKLLNMRLRQKENSVSTEEMDSRK